MRCMYPSHKAIVWVDYESLSSFNGARSFFLSDEDFCRFGKFWLVVVL